jgi:hypothetical protein
VTCSVSVRVEMRLGMIVVRELGAEERPNAVKSKHWGGAVIG